MLADQKTIPSSEEGDRLVAALFHTNSKFLELINQQTEFEHREQEGLNVRSAHTGEPASRRESAQHDGDRAGDHRRDRRSAVLLAAQLREEDEEDVDKLIARR